MRNTLGNAPRFGGYLTYNVLLCGELLVAAGDYREYSWRTAGGSYLAFLNHQAGALFAACWPQFVLRGASRR